METESKKNNTKSVHSTDIAILSPELAWKLLTPEEQKRLLIYLEMMRERGKQANNKQKK